MKETVRDFNLPLAVLEPSLCWPQDARGLFLTLLHGRSTLNKQRRVLHVKQRLCRDIGGRTMPCSLIDTKCLIAVIGLSRNIVHRLSTFPFASTP